MSYKSRFFNMLDILLFIKQKHFPAPPKTTPLGVWNS